jgi:hypothetical protein
MDGNGALEPPKSMSSFITFSSLLPCRSGKANSSTRYEVDIFCNVESDRMQRRPKQIVQLVEAFFCVLAPTFGVNFVPHLTKIHQQTVHERKLTMATHQRLKPTPIPIAVPASHSSLTPNGTTAIGRNLRILTSEVFTLYVKTKGFRRHMRMPNFRDYLRLLDRPNGSEKLLREHVIAISLGLYIETALGPLLGALVVYLHSHWMT